MLEMHLQWPYLYKYYDMYSSTDTTLGRIVPSLWSTGIRSSPAGVAMSSTQRLAFNPKVPHKSSAVLISAA